MHLAIVVIVVVVTLFFICAWISGLNKRERRDFDENELLRRRQELEDIIIDLTERIRIAKLEVYEVKAERDEIDGDKELRQKLREEENELERSRRKK